MTSKKGRVLRRADTLLSPSVRKDEPWASPSEKTDSNPYFCVKTTPWREQTWFHVQATHDLLIVFGRTAESGRIILIRQYRPPVGGYVISAPMGAFAAGPIDEMSHIAAQEASNETGHAVLRIEPFLSIYRSPGLTNERAHLYFAVYAEEPGPQQLHADEDIEVLRILPGDSPEVLRSFARAGDGLDSSILLLLSQERLQALGAF